MSGKKVHVSETKIGNRREKNKHVTNFLIQTYGTPNLTESK